MKCRCFRPPGLTEWFGKFKKDVNEMLRSPQLACIQEEHRHKEWWVITSAGQNVQQEWDIQNHIGIWHKDKKRRADVFSPSPSSPSFLALKDGFLFCGPLSTLEKANLCFVLPPSPPFPGLLFFSALLYGLKGFLPPDFPPSLVPMESGQSKKCH